MSQSRAPAPWQRLKPLYVADTGGHPAPATGWKERNDAQAGRCACAERKKRTEHMFEDTGMRQHSLMCVQLTEGSGKKDRRCCSWFFLRAVSGTAVGRHPVLCVKVACMSLSLGWDQAVSSGQHHPEYEKSSVGARGGARGAVTTGRSWAAAPGRFWVSAFNPPRPSFLITVSPVSTAGQAPNCRCISGGSGQLRQPLEASAPQSAPRATTHRPRSALRVLCLGCSGQGLGRTRARRVSHSLPARRLQLPRGDNGEGGGRLWAADMRACVRGP